MNGLTFNATMIITKLSPNGQFRVLELIQIQALLLSLQFREALFLSLQQIPRMVHSVKRAAQLQNVIAHRLTVYSPDSSAFSYYKS